MNPYLEPQGFLGTGASLLADVTLLAYLLLIIPAMIVGFVFARRGMHRPHHKWTMTAITIVNWILIIFLMLAAYRFDVAGNIGSQPSNTPLSAADDSRACLAFRRSFWRRIVICACSARMFRWRGRSGAAKRIRRAILVQARQAGHASDAGAVAGHGDCSACSAI